MGDGTSPRRAFVLNGSDSPGDMPDRISAALARYLLDRGWHADRMDVHTARIGMCRVCNACAFKTPGECALRDDGRDVPRLMAQSDLFAFVSGIRFGGYPRRRSAHSSARFPTCIRCSWSTGGRCTTG